MLTPSRIYQRLLAILAIAFALSRVAVFFLFKTDPFGQWSLAGIFYSPFFGPAIGGAFLIQILLLPRLLEALLTVALGTGIAFLHAAIGRSLRMTDFAVSHVTFGIGLASLLVMGAKSALTRGEERRRWLSVLLPASVLPAFVMGATFFLSMTAVLNPAVYDPAVFALDDLNGLEPSFLVGRFFLAVSPLSEVCRFVYWTLPMALALVYAARRRQREEGSDDVLFSFFALGVVGFTLYFLFPVAGPLYFYGKQFPYGEPEVTGVATEVLKLPIPRNCMPSLHTAWALLLFWQARPLGLYARIGALSWLVFTLLGTLGFGFHYATDLVIAFPFTVAVHAAYTKKRAAILVERRRALYGGAALAGFWLLWLRFFPAGSGAVSWIRGALMLATVIAACALERALDRKAWSASPPVTMDTAVPSGRAPAPTRTEKGIATIFFVSGFSGLVYEIVFAKSLALTFGSTATASTTVLATYMGGISLGAWIGGELGERRGDPLRVYAFCEVAIALYCAATPLLFSALRGAYVHLAADIDPGSPALVALQSLLGAAVLLPPTTLMGITMPVLTKQFVGAGGLGRSIGLLYGANTLGAGLGSWLTGYVVLPFLGIAGTIWLAVLANLCVGLAALRLSQRPRAAASASPDLSSAGEGPTAPRAAGVIAAMVLCAGGVITLALETTDIHLLAIVAGNSAYAFALMLFAFLVGLGSGAALARRILARGPGKLLHLAMLEMALAAAILVGVYRWEQIPRYFAEFATYPIVRSFASRELIRFVVCSIVMIPPAVCIGAIFPIAMDLVTRAARDPVRATGRASALNTLGNIGGAVVGGFLLVPLAGSLRALQALAAGAAALSLLPLPYLSADERKKVVVPAAALLALFLTQPQSFDYDELSSGANVYFAPNVRGRAIAHAESLDGGLTTVHEALDPAGKRVLTLLTNGKFQGDDGQEMRAQIGFSLYPLLHTAGRDDILVIGLGTGVSAGTAQRAGFRHIDVAELSRDIARISDTYFGPVNGAILRQPAASLHVTDGRNFLLLGSKKYDVITVEVTSIWFAGAATLYNREFYKLAKARLSERGVLQQWIQLHRIGTEDIVSILGTLRSEFPRVWLYFAGSQGILVACAHDCRPSAETLSAIDHAPDLGDALHLVGGRAARLLNDRLLSPESVDRFLVEIASRGLDVDQLVSTDDNLFLEYSTPRGNVRDYLSSLQTNVALLRTFAPDTVVAGTRLTEGDVGREAPAGGAGEAGERSTP